MTGTTEALALRIERVIPASIARVFAAWTEPAQLSRWATPPGLTSGDGTLELRVGGEWSVAMLEPNGRAHHAFGVYREITPPTRLVFTHQWRDPEGGPTPETIVTVELSAEGDATRLVLTQVGFDNVGSRDGHHDGWSQALDQLPNVIAEHA